MGGAMVVPNKAKSGTLKNFLDSPAAKARLAAVARDFMKPEDLIRMALVAIHRNPKLLDCSQESILAALMDAAALRIKPGGLQGRGYLVPRKNKNTQRLECCFDPGWRGLIDIMRRTGLVKRIEAHPVFERDKFRAVFGTDFVLEHEPYFGDEDRGPVIAAYALVELKDGAIQVELLTRRDLAKIRSSSMSQSGPWNSWDDEMARKSAVRRISKYMPFDETLERASRLAAKADPAAEDIDWDIDVTDDSAVDADGVAQEPALPEAPSRGDSLREKLGAPKEQAVPVSAKRAANGAASETPAEREPDQEG